VGRRTLFLALLALGCALPATARIEVRATLSPQRIGIGETAMLTVEVTNDSLSSFRFRPHFELDNFELAGATEQINDMRWGSTGLSRVFRMVWRLRPLSLGRAAVRKITVEVNGTVLPLTDREVAVQRQATRPSEEGQEPADPFSQFFGRWMQPLRRYSEPRLPALFLRQEVEPKRDVVVGQQLLYTTYLYARRDVEVASPAGLPKFKGFWVRDIPQPQRLRSDFVEIGGETYSRVAVLRKALFPLRAGRLEIEPVSFDFAVRVLENNFFGPAIERSESVHLTSPTAFVNVHPLPPEPSGFAGAVGPDFTLTATLNPKQLRMGEAATLTLALGGEGNLQSLDDLQVVAPSGLKISLSQQEDRDQIQGLTLRGDRVWRFAVVPKEAGSFKIDPPRVPYYDPRFHEYRTAAAEILTLTVLPAEPKAVRAGQEPRSPSQALRLAGRLRAALPWGVAGLSTLVALLAVWRLRARSPLGSRKPLPPQSALAAGALRQALDGTARESRAAPLAQQLEGAWRTFLEVAYALPPGTPAARWGDVLAGQGRNGPIRTDLESLLEDVRYLRHAPQLASVDEVRREALAASERLFERLARG